MAMVDRRGLTRQALPAVAASRAAAKRQTRNHRVVIESVVQEQKKLKTTISFQAKPPPGYTFIPAGNPDLTTALKEASRQANRQIYAVTTSPHHKIHDLSKEVHRIGFHFSSAIVAQVCAQYGITLDSKGVVTDENAEGFRQMRRKGQRGDNSDVRKDQITINTEARGAIKDLFPKIPDDDLFTIIKGAFQKGQQKVGTANELPLVRRAQLSVVAHVRHVYTRYDRLLREVGYREARAQVETPTLKKLVEWRGDDDDTTAGKEVLEDVMREVIVLSDDEESDDETDDVVEVVTGRVNGWPLPSHHSVAGTQPLSPRQYDYNSAEEDSAGYRIITQAPRRRRQPDPSLQTGAAPNQYRQSRFSAWDRAREEYRANPSAVPVALVPLSQHDPKFYYHEPEFNFNDSPARLRQAPVDPYTDRRIIYDSRPMQPELVRGRDGALYERVYTQPQYGLAYPDRREIPQAYVSSHPPSPHHASFYGQDHRDQAISSRVLPSIENGQSSALEDGRSHAARTEYRMDQPSGHREDRVQPHALPRNPEIIDLTDGVDAQFAKRQRIEEPHSARRPISDPNSQRHVSGHERLRNEYDISAFETKHDRREIIELSSPKIDRKGPPGRSRIVSGPRKDDLARSRQAHATQIRRVHGAAPTYGQHQEVRLVSPPRFTHDGRIAYGVQNRSVHRPDAEYRPEDPAIRSEDIVARHAAQVLPYHGEDATFSREYMPLNREEPQQPPLFYIDSNGTQRDRDPRMPPPRYVLQ